MNTAKQVDELIKQWTAEGKSKTEIAWNTALACVGWPYVFGAWGALCTVAERKKRYRDAHKTIKTACKAYDGGNCSGCKWFPGGERVRCFDCRGFTDWVLKQVGVDLKGEGATSQWNTASNWKSKGEIGTMPQGVIVCLFYRDKNNKKSMAHTGLGYNGKTVECSSGVQFSKTVNKKWEYWAIPAGIGDDSGIGEPAYHEPATGNTQSSETSSRPTIRKGSRNKYVTECQTILQQLGYNLGICGIDGDFGTATRAAVMQFQTDHGIQVDGIVGKDTWAALDAAAKQIDGKPAEKTYSVIIAGMDLTQAEALARNYPGARIIEGSVG